MTAKKESCKHELFEKLEEDNEEGGTVWARCAECFILFKFSKKEWNESMEQKKVEG